MDNSILEISTLVTQIKDCHSCLILDRLWYMLSVVNVTKTSALNKLNLKVHKVVLTKRMLMDPKVLFNSATVQVV